MPMFFLNIEPIFIWIKSPTWLTAIGCNFWGRLGLLGFYWFFSERFLIFFTYGNSCRKDKTLLPWGSRLGCLGGLLSVGLPCCSGLSACTSRPMPCSSAWCWPWFSWQSTCIAIHREHFSYPIRQLRCRRPLALVFLGSLAGVVVLLAIPVWNHWAAESLVPSELDFTRSQAGLHGA